MSFHEGGWHKRFDAMGDEAEGHFEDEFNGLGLKFVRYGLNRPPISMSRLSARLRYTPDYLCHNRLIEVQGIGRDQTVKLKLDKFNALHWWNDAHPVELYVWDSKNKRSCLVTLRALDKLLDDGVGELRRFHEGKSYFAFPASALFGEEDEDALAA